MFIYCLCTRITKSVKYLGLFNVKYNLFHSSLFSFCFSTFDFSFCKPISIILSWAVVKLIPVFLWCPGFVRGLNDSLVKSIKGKRNELEGFCEELELHSQILCVNFEYDMKQATCSIGVNPLRNSGKQNVCLFHCV